jgi:hypothetical protein
MPLQRRSELVPPGAQARRRRPGRKPGGALAPPGVASPASLQRTILIKGGCSENYLDWNRLKCWSRGAFFLIVRELFRPL